MVLAYCDTLGVRRRLIFDSFQIFVFAYFYVNVHNVATDGISHFANAVSVLHFANIFWMPEFLKDFFKDTEKSASALNNIYQQAVNQMQDETAVEDIRAAIRAICWVVRALIWPKCPI